MQLSGLRRLRSSARHSGLIILLLVVCVPNNEAIITRHDVEPAEFLVDPSQFPAVGQLDHRVETVLIGDRWALTAAHAVEMLGPFDHSAIRFGDRCHPVSRIVVHPDWEGGWPHVGVMHDLALVELENPVNGIEPVPLYEGNDLMGRMVTIAGRGRAGNGMDGPAETKDHQFRRGSNIIDVATDTTLFMIFDEPDSATALEAISGSGDSGGPAFLEIDGRNHLVGISSATTGVPDLTAGLYGTTDLYTRVSTFAGWIRDVTSDAVPIPRWTPPVACGPGNWPDHAAASLADTLFRAWEADSIEDLEQLYPEISDPVERRARAERLHRGLAEQYGPVRVDACSTLGDREIRVLASSNDGSKWFSIGLRRGARDEDHVERLYLKQERSPASLSPCEMARKSEGGSAPLESSPGDLETYLDRLASRGFSGSVLVVHDGEIFLEEGIGVAERSAGLANTSETLFYLASVSKQFTAAAVAKLVAHGRLAFDDTLDELFESVPADKAGITLHQLLTHSSGLVEYVGGVHDRLTRSRALATIFAGPLRFRPGSEYGYSNAAYTLLAMIVEDVTGMTFPQYMHQEIFDPAGMNSTILLGESVSPQLMVAHGYSADGDQGDFSTWTGPAWAHWGSGGVFSNLEDMARWEQALDRYEVVSEAALEWLFTPYVRTRGQHYGYGWRIGRTDYGGPLLYHFGSEDVGMSSAYLRFPRSDTTIIVLSNRDFAARTAVAIARKLLEPDYDEIPDYRD